ncbi:high-potential iron-sulfur protein [Paraburkholderia hospita]|uniref:high-potential iron-sulfur protein n=1 Tax=Paraburkholderia hospita TaxID=169430 RepID=UPI003ECEE18E
MQAASSLGSFKSSSGGKAELEVRRKLDPWECRTVPVRHRQPEKCQCREHSSVARRPLVPRASAGRTRYQRCPAPCPMFGGKQLDAKGWCSAYSKKAWRHFSLT